ncbi:MAG: hypothetical protein ACPGO3_07980 [Magnetospiraceae bacterium]
MTADFEDREREELVAYIDDTEDPKRSENIDFRLADDPEARAFVERLRATGIDLREAYGPVLEEPVPARLIEAVRNAGPATPGTGPSWRFLAAAVIAAFLFGAGGGAGTSLLLENQARERYQAQLQAFQAAATKTLNQALEERPSGTIVNWDAPEIGAAAVYEIVKTYRNADGLYCREYLETVTINGVPRQSRDLACRQHKADWKTRMRWPVNAL